MAGEWDELPNVSFCLHVKGSRPRTTYPWSPFVLTGFDHWGAVWGAKGWGCDNNASARRATGGPRR